MLRVTPFSVTVEVLYAASGSSTTLDEGGSIVAVITPCDAARARVVSSSSGDQICVSRKSAGEVTTLLFGIEAKTVELVTSARRIVALVLATINLGAYPARCLGRYTGRARGFHPVR